MTDADADKTSRIKIGNYQVLPEDAALIEAYNVDQKRRGLLPATLIIREQRLALFAQDCGPILEVEPAQIEEWLDTRKKRDGTPVTDKTRSCWLSDLGAFFTWAERAEHLPIRKCQLPTGHMGSHRLTKQPADNPCNADFMNKPVDKIIRPRLHQKGPRPISIAALTRALEASSGILKCWITIEALQGLRCQEVAALAAEDFDLDRMLLLVRMGKGGKERMLPLHPDVAKVLSETELPKRGRLWPDATPAVVSRRINDHLHGLGIRDTAHSLRHFFASSLYISSNADLRLTQTLMGHSSPQVTAIYAAFDTSKALGAVSAISLTAPTVSANPQVSVVA